ncbi:165_t:CDS:2 [Acaulospora morrowiae]|uniref:165_t:CDS:1 n=1 Tax=Acaulospora morrowiae TaxID=94023 RepID=A0A9N9GDH3_9GLOM|nr:165_t:CDS:2 [Acaulospora morrowiae]
MGSTTASPEASPTRSDRSRKPGSEIYIPRQRRSLTGEEQLPDSKDNVNNDNSDNQDNTVIRKGRGKFCGPGSDNQQDQQVSRAARGRDFDATSLRQYPPKAGDKTPSKGHARRKSKSDKRNSNGFQGSESGGSGSDNNASDDVARVTNSLENLNVADSESELKPAPQPDNTPSTPQEHLRQDSEEWEKNADGETKNKTGVTSPVTSPAEGVPNPFDWQANKQKLDGQKNDNAKNDNKTGFKKSHRKNKSSKIEFNFDPDAFEGSTRILDVLDFPASFKTHHLHEIFQEYETMRGGYHIKWMDDTRALIVFEHPATARKAYLDNVNNQLATIKPYEGPTDFLQKNPSQPRARPPTTDMVAKRLVHGALGVRVARSPEQRQAEIQILRNAKDQRDQRRNESIRRSQDLDAAFNE